MNPIRAVWTIHALRIVDENGRSQPLDKGLPVEAVTPEMEHQLATCQKKGLRWKRADSTTSL